MIITLLLFLAALSQAADSNIVIARGQTYKMPVSPSEKIRFTNKDVVNVKDLGKYLAITGTKIGYTSATTSRGVLKFTIAGVETARSYLRLKDIFLEMKGLEVDANSNMAIVQGELLRFSDWESLAEISRTNNISYNFAAKLSPELHDQAQMFFRRLLAKAELAPVHFALETGARAILPLEFLSRKAQYKKVLAPYGFEIEIDNSTVALAPMIEVEILVAEVERSFLRRFGVSWPSEIGFQIAPASGGVSFNSLEMALQAQEAKGSGRILASPKLLCRSGKEAEFLAGGEIPIAVRDKFKSEVVWKKHGVILKIKPLADLSGRMSIDLETEVSIANTKDNTSDLPTFKTNRIKSHFDLEGTRTIALSGLLKSVEGNGRRGIPILSDIPIIGPIFSSREYLEERTELVFFVTPRLVPYDTPSTNQKLPVWENQ